MEEPKKRGRGRPKKANVEPKNAVEKPKKRGPGRPKKAKVEPKNAVFKPNTEKAKLSLPPRKFRAAKFKGWVRFAPGSKS